MNKNEFNVASFNAYVGYVEYMEDKISMSEAIDKMFPAFYEYGHKIDCDNFVKIITVYMTAFAKDGEEKARKIKSVSTMRKLIKTDWTMVENARVSSHAGKQPTIKTKEEKAEEKNAKRAQEALDVLQSAGMEITEELRQAYFTHTWGKAVVK